MNKRRFVSVLAIAASLRLLAACTTTASGVSDAGERRRNIDVAVDGALTDLHQQVKGSGELISKAKGVLVFPSVVSAGFVLARGHGEGALRSSGRTAAYYSTTSVSAGLLAGSDSKALYMLFMTQEALDEFTRNSGWTAGAHAVVSFLDDGANADVDARRAQQPVIGFVLTNRGMLGGLSLEGTKISKLDL